MVFGWRGDVVEVESVRQTCDDDDVDASTQTQPRPRRSTIMSPYQFESSMKVVAIHYDSFTIIEEGAAMFLGW